MGLRDIHEEFLSLTVESRDHYGQDVIFDLSSPSLAWWNDEVGAVPGSAFTLGGWANIVGENGALPNAADGTTHRSSVTVRLSSMVAECVRVPAEGTRVEIVTRTGTRRFVVEPGMTRVDEDLGRIHYYLTDVESV